MRNSINYADGRWLQEYMGTLGLSKKSLIESSKNSLAIRCSTAKSIYLVQGILKKKRWPLNGFGIRQIQ